MNGVIDMVPNLILYVFILTHVLWRWTTTRSSSNHRW
jgi:hypothetical protein